MIPIGHCGVGAGPPRRAGMQAAHFRRWIPPEHFPEQPGDFAPHVSVATLEELLTLLGV